MKITKEHYNKHIDTSFLRLEDDNGGVVELEHSWRRDTPKAWRDAAESGELSCRLTILKEGWVLLMGSEETTKKTRTVYHASWKFDPDPVFRLETAEVDNFPTFLEGDEFENAPEGTIVFRSDEESHHIKANGLWHSIDTGVSHPDRLMGERSVVIRWGWTDLPSIYLQ